MCDGPGACRPVIGPACAALSLAQKVQVIILLLLLFSRGPVSSLLFFPSERVRQREADTEWEADSGFQRQGAGCTGVGDGFLDGFCVREGMSVIGSVMRKGTEWH